MEVRTVISSHSFQVTHADTQLVSSQLRLLTWIITSNTLLESDSHYYTVNLSVGALCRHLQLHVYFSLIVKMTGSVETYHSFHLLKTVTIRSVHRIHRELEMLNNFRVCDRGDKSRCYSSGEYDEGKSPFGERYRFILCNVYML